MKEDVRKKLMDKEIAFFSEYVSEHKQQLFRDILETRTRYFTIVLEDIYQSQNASAVLRSCDGFGFQDVHVVENRNVFDVDKGVTIGADKWLTVYRYKERGVNNTGRAYRFLRQEGYRIVSVTPVKSRIPLPGFRPEKPTALVFGTEQAGLSDYAADNADEHIHIPMYGFSESFNISVCVALCLYHLRLHLKERKKNWQLTKPEKQELYLQWLRKSVKHLKALDKKFRETYKLS